MDRSRDPSEFRESIAALVRRQLGGEIAGIEPMVPGLGTRLFLRVRISGSHVASAIARIEMPEDPASRPAGVPAEPALEPLRSFLEAAGLPVPCSYGRDGPIQLLEDGGEQSLEDAAGTLSPDQLRTVYAQAARLVPRLQRLSAAPDEIPAFGRRLDSSLFAYKARLFAEWALPLALARPAREMGSKVVDEAFAWIADECERAPARLSHRDFKAANLLVREADSSVPQLMLIDLQGAFLAPPEYDLVCLLRDSHVAIPEAEVQHLLEDLRCELPDAPKPETFERRFALLTLTRVGKDLARYLYAAGTRDDQRYLPLVPRAVSLLRDASSAAAHFDPCLERLADLIHQLPRTMPGAKNSEGADSSCVQ